MSQVDWPLQTDNNCVAFSYWVAMRVALQVAEPYRCLPADITPQLVQSCIGAPAGAATPKTLGGLRSMFGGAFTFKPVTNTTYRLQPQVCACWDQGIAHAVCLLPNRDNFVGYAYDPALGNTARLVDMDKTADAVEVVCAYSKSDFPYKKWYYGFGFMRALHKRFNWI